MNENFKAEIKKLRLEGLGYKRISKELDVSIDRVKYFCRKNGLTGVMTQTTISPSTQCQFCDQLIIQAKGKKGKKFCSDICRQKWWNQNRHLLNGRKSIEHSCPTCQNVFKAYIQENRKFCSHQCYINARFGGVQDESA